MRGIVTKPDRFGGMAALTGLLREEAAMRSLFKLLLGALAAIGLGGLAGCDGGGLQTLKPGVSTGHEVRERLGRPGLEWRNADGSVTWEYSRQPEGTECWMATIGPDNVLSRLENVLTPENFARVEPGWSREQVRRLLGKPRSVQRFSLKQEEVWDWRLTPEFSADVFFNIHFDADGRVTRSSRSLQPRG